MLMKSSSTYNESDPHQQLYTTDFFFMYFSCLISRPASIITYVYIIVHVFLLLPITVLILYHILLQRIKCSVLSAGGMNHSDCFTFNLALMELIGALGYILIFCDICKENSTDVFEVGTVLTTITWFGEICVHVLTCLERYLAVVHPITYLNLKKETGIRIRNLIIGCVWILSFVGNFSKNIFTTVNFCLLLLSIIMVSFFSISVLRVLIRSGPGDQVGSRERVDQSKRRAFYIIVVILVVLMVRFVWGLFWAVVNETIKKIDCIIFALDFWTNLPSSLILPVLFLFRAGKCVCCKKTIYIKR